MSTEAFFTLHSQVQREGPGDSASLQWAVERAKVRPDARILDAGCGPGADIGELLAAAPRGHVTAIDTHAPFVERVQAAWRGDARVTARQGDMADPGGVYDFIWCAGALYFPGIVNGLRAFRKVLAPGGAVAFSELVWLVPNPASEVRAALTREYPAIGGHMTLQTRIADAGYELQGATVLRPAAWEAYFGPLEERIAQLRPDADADLRAVLQEQAAEIDLWRRYRTQFGYALSVVRPA